VLALTKTFSDVRSYAFLKGLAITIIFSTLAAYSFAVVEFNNFRVSFLLHLLLSHIVMVYTLNVVNEVDVWSDVTDSSRYSN